MRPPLVILISLLLFAGTTVHAAHTQANLLLSANPAAPGSTVLAGVELKMEPGWHTYWKNPGAAGEVTEIKWQLPAGVTAGEIQWPLPEKIPPLDITTYGYENDTVLLVPLTLASNLPAGPLDLKARVTWLECKESCIPAGAEVEATLRVGPEARPASGAAVLQAWQEKVPKVAANFSGRAWWEGPATGDTRMLILQWPGDSQGADFYPAANDNFEVQGETQPLTGPAGQIRLRKAVKKYSGNWPREIFGVFVATNRAVEARVSIADGPSSTAAGGSVAAATSPVPGKSLWQMLLYAFIGGLILNIMPCVLPVIALKILGFVNEAKSSPRHVRLLGLVYAAGVCVSFLVLAGVIIGVKAAGHKAGWGMQFGSPVFVVCLTTLVTLVAMNLFGIFEVALSGRALDAAGGLSAKPGVAGAFFNGVLATALATPCTAPFLSIALGFAFAQSAMIILLVFLAVAVGLASPYVVLSWHPGWLKLLPKPGAWMEKFKMAMAFPMLLTVVWLFSIAAGNYGDRVVWLGVFLVLMALAAWIFGEFVQRGNRHQKFAAILAVAVLAADYTFVLEDQLDWRRAGSPAQANPETVVEDGIAWQPWSPEAVTLARASGRPMLVDFTADWCLTCQVNKRTSLDVPSVREKLKSLNAITLLADYTHFPDSITTELNHFNRAGVPLVLVYPKESGKPPIVLPEVLTPGIVLAALDEAAD
jgi:thiol:disulfide interchange protein DsbD